MDSESRRSSSDLDQSAFENTPCAVAAFLASADSFHKQKDLDSDVLSRFRSAPWRFDVWQASAILEAWRGRIDLGVPASDSIPAGQVCGVSLPENDPSRLDVHLFGLVGTDGPLPPHVTQLVRERSREGDPAFQDFLDLFHSRLLHLWRNESSSLCPELRTSESPEDHPFAMFLEAISGMPNTGNRSREIPMPGPIPGWGDVPEALFRSCAAAWARQPRSAAGLEKLMHTAFGVRAKVEAFCGAWVDTPDDDRTRLGKKDVGNARLGASALLGHRMFDAAAGITLHLGPLTETQRRMFLPPPSGTRRADVLALVRWYFGDIGCEVILETDR